MHFELLADRVEAIPIVAGWYFEEGWRAITENSVEKTAERIRGQLNRGKLPLLVLAVDAECVVGVAELKPHEMLSVYPDKEPWLGGVFVRQESRNKGIASQLALRIAEIAKSFGVEELYLQTTALDGGLYARLGWMPVEQIRYRGVDVLLMVKELRQRRSC